MPLGGVMRRLAFCRPAVGCIIAGVVSSCGAPGVLSDRAIDFNNTLAQAADKQLLLNIVRAAFRNPTRYSAISKLTEQRVTEASLTVGGQIPVGQDAADLFGISPSGTLKHNRTPLLDVAPLDERKFALGLFAPIDPKTFATYWRQRWPASVLLFLLVDDVTLNPAAKEACGLTTREVPGDEIDNAAYDAGQFAVMLKFVNCIVPQISLKEESSKSTYITGAPIAPAEILKKLPDLVKDGFAVNERTNKSERTYTISKAKTQWTFKLRFDGRPGVAMAKGEGDSARPPHASGTPAVVFTMRSVDGIIYYLGELVRAQLKGEFEARVPYGPNKVPTVLFKVDVNAGPTLGDRIEVEFLNQRFAVPRTPDSDDLTLTVLSLLSQLFSLHRESLELPKTTTVQVLGQ
jgi:hypothetical protein